MVNTRSLWAPTGPSLAPRPSDVLSHRLVGSRLSGVVGRAEPSSLGVGGVQKGDLGAVAHGTFGRHLQLKVRLPAWWLRLLRTGSRSAERGIATTLAMWGFAVATVHFVVHKEVVLFVEPEVRLSLKAAQHAHHPNTHQSACLVPTPSRSPLRLLWSALGSLTLSPAASATMRGACLGWKW